MDAEAFSIPQWLAFGGALAGLFAFVTAVLRAKAFVRKEVRSEIEEYLDSGRGRKQVGDIAKAEIAVDWNGLMHKLDRLADSVQALVDVTKEHDRKLEDLREEVRTLKR